MSHHLLQLLKPLETYQARKRASMGLRSSAILIPIVDRPQGQLVYTLRSQHLKNHAGQISFPGGRIEPEEDPLDAALREAHEEIGLNPADVTLMGRLDDVFSPRGFHIQCFVGLVSPEFQPQINYHEVERLVNVDLNELFEQPRHEIKLWNGMKKVHYFHFEEGTVWGVTGQITWYLREVLKSQQGHGGLL